jgi:predicted MFS family arabinose efflux permease
MPASFLGSARPNRRAIAAALVLGAGVTWNISNVGAVADPLADAYGVSLAVVGLFTTALFVTHLLVQIPGGRACDRIGARNVGFFAVGAVVAGNLLLLTVDAPALAVAARAVVGLGSGAGFVAGAEYMRAAHASAVLQGIYGAATMAGGGLAIAIVPQVEPSFGWRAPYWSALAAAAVPALGLAASPLDLRTAPARTRLLADRRLVRLGLIHGATFGLSVVGANWVVPLLERHGHPRGTAAALGSLLLLGGIVTRPLGGFVVASRWSLAGALVAGAGAFAVLATPAPLAALGVAAAVAGLAAGLPFAAVFAGAQRIRPDAPGAAIGFVNTWAIAAVVAGTPLLGLAFSLPGEGRIGFACLAGLWLAALAATRPRERSRR